MSGLTTPLAGHGARTPTRRVHLALALLLLCQFVLLPPRVSHGAAPSALSFNGLNSYVSVADAPSLRIPVNMTVEAWIKPTAVSGHRHVMGKNEYELAVEPLGTGFMALFEFASGGGWRSVTSGELALNQWYHVAGTYDGATMRLFVNGMQVASLAGGGTIDQTANPLRIGSAYAAGDFFAGSIDEVRLSSVVRYTGNFAVPTAPFAPDANTKGLWHLDEGAGTSTGDASGLGNNGTLVSGPVWTTDSPFAPSTTTDTTPPVVSAVSASSITTNSAIVIWTTDEGSTSQVEYGPTTAYGSTTAVDPTLVTGHSQTLSGLGPDTLYNYRVISRDAAGNQSVSANATFRTQSTSPTAGTAGEWSPLMSWPLVAVHTTLLHTGEVLVWDAWERPSLARLWNPTTQTFKDVPTASGLFCAGNVTLADGRVLVIGGHADSEVGIPDANIFDPATSTWTRAADMTSARWYPTGTTLGDGRVVTVSGQISPNVWADTPEVYNPATNSWSALSAVRTPEIHEGQYPLDFLLPNGKLLVVASSNGQVRTLDVASQAWATVASTPVKNGSAAMYRPGKILMTGGGDPAGPGVLPTTAVIDMNQPLPAWRQTAPMASGRYLHNMVVLPDGKVFAVGGSTDLSDQSTVGTVTTELWDPATETWTTMASLGSLRMYHSTALLLPDGRVLAAGGGRLSPAPDMLTAEIYSPPYLFKGARPTITSAPSAAAYGAALTVQTPDAASIASVSLVHLASVTHTIDMNQRYLDLSFTKGADALTVQSPSDRNMAPPGYYMLFVLNANGVPSVAKIVQLGGTAADTTPPVISGVQATGIATTGATISWTTDEPATSQVEYGPTAAYGAQTALDATLVTGHGQTLSGLTPGTTYHHRVRSADAAGNVAVSADFTFTTVADTTPPDTTITSGPPALSAGAGATFGFASSEAGGTFRCSLDGAPFGGCASPATFTGLADGAHTFQVAAVDAAGNADPSPATHTWTIDTAAPETTITSGPTSPTNSTSASFDFASGEAGATFACSLDGAPFAPCTSPVSLSGLVAGAHTFQVRASDPAGNVDKTPASHTWTVDLTPPVLALPGPITAEATSSAGAVVTYVASANDAVSGPASASCAPASGAVFALGTTAVACTATDAAGNTATGSFTVTVTVPDTTPPVLSLPVNIAVTATGPSGAAVTYAATADDAVSGPVTPACTPASGSTFPIATTTVTCAATDAAGNTAAGSFTVTVADTTPPVLSLPGNMTVDATGPDGAVVTYAATAADAVSGPATPACSPASGATLPFGATTVTCTATDAAGNTATGSFTVTVADTTPPAVAASGVPVGWSATSPVVVTIDASDAVGLASVSYSLDGAPAVAAPASGMAASVAVPVSGDGAHTLSYWATDAAGNAGAAATATVRIDTTPPDTTITSGPLALSNSASTTFAFASSDAGSTFACSLDGASFAPCASPATYTGLADGGHAFQVQATDPAGNADPTPASFGWTVDATAPVVGAVEATGDPTGTTATITWTTNEAADGQVEYGTTTAYGSTTALDPALVTSHSQTLTGLVPGTLYHYRVTSRDAAGNPGVSGDLTFTFGCPDAYEAQGDDSSATTNTIAVGVDHAQRHTFDAVGDQDWVRLSAVAGHQYTIDGLNVASSADLVLNLYGPDGTTLLRSADGGGLGGGEQIVWTAPTSGTYLIRASELAGTGGCVAYGYDLRVTAQADLPVAQDTFIHQNSDQNFGASTDLSLDSRSNRQDRVLVEFDVSSIPAGATVESAILNLNLRSAKTSTPISVAAHRLTRAWTESDAGWNQADGSTNWTTPGGDYDPTVLSTATEAATLGWYGWEVTAAARAWRSGAPNHGLILRATTSTQFNNEKLHQSSEATTNRPFLRVVYSDP